MPYKRTFYEKPAKPHPLEIAFGHHRQFSIKDDPGWIYNALDELMTDGNFALSQLSSTLERVRGMNLSEYKDKIAIKKRMEPIHKARQA